MGPGRLSEDIDMNPNKAMAKTMTLVTGASAGIGAELARVFAERGHDLILVARSEGKLQALADELSRKHRIRAEVIAMDLGDPRAPQALFDEVKRRQFVVDTLVNNAGLLVRGPFTEQKLEDHLALLQVNVMACVALAHVFMRPMLERGAGRILNVASTSAFQPLPHISTYAAGKAFLLSFSEALAMETRGRGVTVTAMCPGFTATDLIAAKDGHQPMSLPGIRVMTAREVAEQGYTACMVGKPVYINGLANRVVAEVTRTLPRGLRNWTTLQLSQRQF
jgi:short-subunit dehydrogenase